MSEQIFIIIWRLDASVRPDCVHIGCTELFTLSPVQARPDISMWQTLLYRWRLDHHDVNRSWSRCPTVACTHTRRRAPLRPRAHTRCLVFYNLGTLGSRADSPPTPSPACCLWLQMRPVSAVCRLAADTGHICSFFFNFFFYSAPALWEPLTWGEPTVAATSPLHISPARTASDSCLHWPTFLFFFFPERLKLLLLCSADHRERMKEENSSREGRKQCFCFWGECSCNIQTTREQRRIHSFIYAWSQTFTLPTYHIDCQPFLYDFCGQNWACLVETRPCGTALAEQQTTQRRGASRSDITQRRINRLWLFAITVKLTRLLLHESVGFPNWHAGNSDLTALMKNFTYLWDTLRTSVAAKANRESLKREGPLKMNLKGDSHLKQTN